MTLTRTMSAAASIAVTLWLPGALAGEPAGAMPGDDALSCEQIYAQGAAEAQREQAERDRKNQERRAEGHATAALLTGAMLTGGTGGTGQAAQKAAEMQADKQMAELTPPPANPRKDRLRQLWTQKHCVKQ